MHTNLFKKDHINWPTSNISYNLKKKPKQHIFFKVWTTFVTLFLLFSGTGTSCQIFICHKYGYNCIKWSKMKKTLHFHSVFYTFLVDWLLSPRLSPFSNHHTKCCIFWSSMEVPISSNFLPFFSRKRRSRTTREVMHIYRRDFRPT